MTAGREPPAFSPDAVAESYFNLYVQDSSAYTLEIDLRPSVECF
jgi:hypothetical protein